MPPLPTSLIVSKLKANARPNLGGQGKRLSNCRDSKARNVATRGID